VPPDPVPQPVVGVRATSVSSQLLRSVRTQGTARAPGAQTASSHKGNSPRGCAFATTTPPPAGRTQSVAPIAG
jgi:hypothetical protein